MTPLALIPQNGEILPLKTLTYVALGVTLAALMITFLFLTLLRALRSNQHGIRRNLTAALGLAQLVFLLGINQADLPVRYFLSQRPSPLPAPPRLPGDPSPAFSRPCSHSHELMEGPGRYPAHSLLFPSPLSVFQHPRCSCVEPGLPLRQHTPPGLPATAAATSLPWVCARYWPSWLLTCVLALSLLAQS